VSNPPSPLQSHQQNDYWIWWRDSALTVSRFALHPGAVVTPQTKNHAGGAWGDILADDEGLAGAFCVWLSKERRDWLSGRFVSSNWDVEELGGMKEKIVKGDLLKYRMVV